MVNSFESAAYGGTGWQQRDKTHYEEIGGIWSPCGLNNEWAKLKAVLLHSPGEEIRISEGDIDQLQMLELPDVGRAQEEHSALVENYENQGVKVTLLEPPGPVRPNQMFCADLFAMTPAGAVLARPASTVRAGEEIEVARSLAALGIPILKTLTGTATFEGADLIWINGESVILGQGLRTNAQAASQIANVLQESNIQVHPVDMPFGTMHLMGMLRIVDKHLALAWPRRTPHKAVRLLMEAGYEVKFIPQHPEFDHGKAFNFVTLDAKKILMVEGNSVALDFYQSLGIECIETPAKELSKAAGAVGCLTGILHREAESPNL